LVAATQNLFVVPDFVAVTTIFIRDTKCGHAVQSKSKSQTPVNRMAQMGMWVSTLFFLTLQENKREEKKLSDSGRLL